MRNLVYILIAGAAAIAAYFLYKKQSDKAKFEGTAKAKATAGGPKSYVPNAATEGGLKGGTGGNPQADVAGKLDASLPAQNQLVPAPVMKGNDLMNLRQSKPSEGMENPAINNTSAYFRVVDPQNPAKALLTGLQLMRLRRDAGQPIIQHPGSDNFSGGIGNAVASNDFTGASANGTSIETSGAFNK